MRVNAEEILRQRLEEDDYPSPFAGLDDWHLLQPLPDLPHQGLLPRRQQYLLIYHTELLSLNQRRL